MLNGNNIKNGANGIKLYNLKFLASVLHNYLRVKSCFDDSPCCRFSSELCLASWTSGKRQVGEELLFRDAEVSPVERTTERNKLQR